MNKDISQLLQNSIPFLSPLVFVNPVLAQITPDGTVPTQVNQSGNVTEITGGAEQGNNLFHSFKEFSVPTGSEAFFNNASNIENIFSRVTGGLRSNIDGLISANGSANLFLINPAGILFGRDARLDIGGSFYGSTADSLLFDDGIEFSAVNPQNPILTINAPIGLRFRDNPAPITYRSTPVNEMGLIPSIKSNQTFAFIGGDINMQDSILGVAPEARIELGGLSASGTVEILEDGSLRFPDGIKQADISLTGVANIIIDGAGETGGLTINARNLELFGQSGIFVITSNVSQVQDRAIITINASDRVALFNETIILGQLNGEAVDKVRAIDINTRSLEIISDLSIQESPFAATISALGLTESVPQNEINILSINASDKVLVNKGLIVGEIETGGGQRGGMKINTSSLELTDGAQVILNNSITSEKEANIGTLEVNADQVIVNNSELSTDIGEFLGITENSGTNVDITAKSVEVVNSGKISADSIVEGEAGSVIITTEQLTVSDNSEINVSSELGGSAGNLEITAESVNLDGGRLTASTEAETGGNINLIVDDRITLRNNSQITAEATGNADGGSIALQTEQLTVQDNSEITASATGEGSGGEVQITAESLNLNGGTIAAETAAETGGNITLDIDDNITLRNNSQITAQATGDADGGNINIDADLIIATPNQNSDILASAGQEGTGGRIVIDAEGVFGIEERPENDTTNDINASGGIDGEVIINTPDVDISKGLIETPQNVLALEQIVAQACSSDGIARGNSTLIVNGRGGISPEPTALISNDDIYTEEESFGNSTEAVQKKFQVDITDKEEKRNIVTLVDNSNPLSIDDIIPARGAIILENGDVILTAYPTPNSGYRSAHSQANCTL
ncbi:MAG: filamentous hemagglutinin N-terminal domain-containing protein [Xenococcaceae cyanobacterium MO_188.B29]|nr:filamentous hemagglutinin N-terminal domain-containing protein [Xenococcaceae cyanobacterium MO_188.B29]